MACSDPPSGPDDGLVGTPEVTLSRVVVEIEGVGDPDPATPIEVYGESYAIINNAIRALPDSALLLLDGRVIHSVTEAQEVRTTIAPAQLSTGEHTLILRGFKSLNGKTKQAEASKELTLERP